MLFARFVAALDVFAVSLDVLARLSTSLASRPCDRFVHHRPKRGGLASMLPGRNTGFRRDVISDVSAFGGSDLHLLTSFLVGGMVFDVAGALLCRPDPDGG